MKTFHYAGSLRRLLSLSRFQRIIKSKSRIELSFYDPRHIPVKEILKKKENFDKKILVEKNGKSSYGKLMFRIEFAGKGNVFTFGHFHFIGLPPHYKSF